MNFEVLVLASPHSSYLTPNPEILKSKIGILRSKTATPQGRKVLLLVCHLPVKGGEGNEVTNIHFPPVHHFNQ